MNLIEEEIDFQFKELIAMLKVKKQISDVEIAGKVQIYIELEGVYIYNSDDKFEFIYALGKTISDAKKSYLDKINYRKRIYVIYPNGRRKIINLQS